LPVQQHTLEMLYIVGCFRPQLLQVLIGLFELPQDTTAVSDDIPLVDPDADNAGIIYTVLMHLLLS